MEDVAYSVVGGDGAAGSARRRVLVPQALGADEFLRVTWHSDRRVMVFSHWEGERCVAATPVRVDQLGELAELVVGAALRGCAASPMALTDPVTASTAWPAPEAWPAPAPGTSVGSAPRRSA